MKLPQRANHKTMKGDDLLKKVVSKLFKPKGIGLDETYKHALTEKAHERNEQTKGGKETKKV